ncbi:MAG: AAA family ATPase, partial [Candidatus Nanohaloarchaea archaeon]
MIQVNNPNIFKRALKDRAVMEGDIIVPSDGKDRRGSLFDDFFDMETDQLRLGFGAETKLAVVSTKPEGAVKITEQTEIEMRQQAVEPEEQEQVKVPEVTYEDIGGLDDEIKQVR